MADGTDTSDAQGVSRRQVLKWMVAGGGAYVVGSQTGVIDLGPQLLTASNPPAYLPPTSILLARADDGLFVTLSFSNLLVQPRKGKTPQLVLQRADADGFITLGLPPQSILERATKDEGSVPPPLPDPPLVETLLSGPSRVAVVVPKGSPPIDWSSKALLDLAAFPLSVSTVASEGKDGPLVPGDAPTATQTFIEAPYRLVLSPDATARFAAVPTPVTRNKRTELWHARATVDDDTSTDPVAVRAVWSQDLVAPLTTPEWATNPDTVSLTPDNRLAIIKETTRKTPGAPALADLLLVSPMGASLNVTGKWPDSDLILAWRHRSWLGRDNYVKVETPGFLFPFGFRAVEVRITERTINGGYAYLRTQTFIVVREPTVHYDPETAVGLPNEGRFLPFTQATTTTLVTPPLASASGDDDRNLGAGHWVRVRGRSGDREDVRFQLVLTSQDNHVVTTDLPLAFIPAGTITNQDESNPAYNQETMRGVASAYHSARVARRTLHLGGQRVGFIPRHSPGGEDPSLPTFDLVLESIVPSEATTTVDPGSGATMGPTLGASDDAFHDSKRLHAYPSMASAQVRIETLDAISSDQKPFTLILPNKGYVEHGFPAQAGIAAAEPLPNAGEVWADIKKELVDGKDINTPNLAVPQQTGGGMAAPAFASEALSRVHGPVADPVQIAKGEFNPEAYFKLDAISLLGGIPLSKLLGDPTKLPKIPNPRGPEGDNVPKVVTTRTDTTLDTVITWKPAIETIDLGLIKLLKYLPKADETAENRLTLQAKFHTELATQAATSIVTGELRGITLDFAGAIQMPFTRVKFESRNGGKPSLDVQLGKPGFAGDLQFLNTLQDKLPSLPGGAKIDVGPSGIKAGMTLALPTISIGVVLVENLSIGIGIDIPFDGGQMVLGFSFCTREHPFHVTVMALGGGGFLGIGIGMRGIQYIEGALEFGASVALDFGVASGSVSIMAGIYIKYSQALTAGGEAKDDVKGNSVVITGYVRALGELEVLGLIHASIELYLGLTFRKDDPKKEGVVEGTATMSVRVEVLFFSESVSITMHKEFGSGADPSFGDQITSGDWSTYCAAFAA